MKKPKPLIAYTCSMGLVLSGQPIKVWRDIETAKRHLDCLDECDIIKIKIQKVRKVKV